VTMNWRLTRSAAVAAIGLILAAAPGAAGAGTFVQPVTVLQTLTGPEPGAGGYFGWAVSELRDIDHDGVTDVIIGEPQLTAAGRGRTWVYSGRTGRLLYRFHGVGSDAQGYAIADAGDVDGDGVSDIVTGAPGDGTDAGRAYLYSGATGKLIHRFAGFANGDSFGAAVSSAGDVNHDGRADLLIGAPGSGAVGSPAGHAYVFSGRTFRRLETLTAGNLGDSFGSATDWTPDVNRDNVPDEIVGAKDAGPVPAQPGAAYVYSGRTGKRLYRIDPPATAVEFGSFFVAGVGDTNGDRIPDVYVADYNDSTNGAGSGRAAVYSGADGHELRSWLGGSGDGLGPGREAGDVNGDGKVDLIVGSYTSSDGASQAGKAQVFSGADGSLIRTTTSTTENENFGFDAVGIGDTNHDGRPDYLVSAANLDTVYVIAG
jgi:FG-GAP repeat/FG-GAP-like repeat